MGGRPRPIAWCRYWGFWSRSIQAVRGVRTALDVRRPISRYEELFVARNGRATQHNGEMSKPGTAAVLSFVVPGVGQIYNGDFIRGIFWLIITPGFWVGTGGTLGWICHLVASFTAYRRAEQQERTVPTPPRGPQHQQ